MQAKRPTSAGTYRIEGLLASGGMGDVYRGHGVDGLPVAAKLLPRDAARDANLRRRFELEAKTVRALDHPTIVRILDVFDDENGHWIVMELAEGETLYDRIERRGPLSARRLVPLVRRIAEGLGAAHAQGIVHRDLKSENIIITPQGDVRILDFGLAKHLLRESTGPSLTGDGTMIGTCRAMSPEQALADRIDHRSDLFSLGVLCYEALTGVSPFAAPTPLKTVSRLVSGSHRPLAEHGRRVPAGLAALVDALLAKMPEDRPQSAAEVIARLDQLGRSPGGLKGWWARLRGR